MPDDRRFGLQDVLALAIGAVVVRAVTRPGDPLRERLLEVPGIRRVIRAMDALEADEEPRPVDP